MSNGSTPKKRDENHNYLRLHEGIHRPIRRRGYFTKLTYPNGKGHDRSEGIVSPNLLAELLEPIHRLNSMIDLRQRLF